MKQEFYNLQIKTNGQKLYEFTNDTIHWIGQNNFGIISHHGGVRMMMGMDVAQQTRRLLNH